MNWIGLTTILAIALSGALGAAISHAQDTSAQESGRQDSSLQNTGLQNTGLQNTRVTREGKHIRLTTDLSDVDQVEMLVATFDHAVDQWRTFLGLTAGSLDGWHVDAYVMKDPDGFRRDGLIDFAVPDFPYGYSLGNQVYVKVQPSSYYTRHLLLHEGIHSLAADQFGGIGPVWYAEGLAEKLATHRGMGLDAVIGIIPGDRDSFPYWGRFKRMDQLRQSGELPRVEQVMKYEPNLRGDVESYAWSWALVTMMSAYPEYAETLTQAGAHGRDSQKEFNRWIFGRLREDWPRFQARWYNLIQDFDYGFDFARERIDVSRQDPIWDRSAIQMEVNSNIGWQSTGVRFAKGTVVNITARGEVILDDQPKPWISEPEGVTIQYHNGSPIGRLMARIVPNVPTDSGSLPLLQTIGLGDGATIRFDQASWLLLRVNDHLDGVANNKGSYKIEIR